MFKGPQDRTPQYIIIIIMESPKMVPLILGNYQMPLLLEEFKPGII